MDTDNEHNISKENMPNMQTGDGPASSTSTLKSELVGWTKDEKYYLFLGIKHKGSKDLKAIQDNIPTKTLKEIKTAIAHYKERANKNPECARKKLKIRKCRAKPLIPLASWAKVLTDNRTYNELQTELVSVFRLIADLDDIPNSTVTDQIDFRKVYHLIADAMEGKSLPDISLIAEVLNSCILETALISKHFINVSMFKNIVSSVNFKDKTLVVFPRPTKDCELTIVRHLASQDNYNPLGIPEENLLPMPNVPIVYPK